MNRVLWCLVCGICLWTTGRCSSLPKSEQTMSQWNPIRTPPSQSTSTQTTTSKPLLLSSPVMPTSVPHKVNNSSTDDAISSMYFHQKFYDQQINKQDNTNQQQKPIVTINRPNSTNPVGNLDNRNLSSSETQHYYGYEPNQYPGYSTSIDHGSDQPYDRSKRHYYPPVPMDVINKDEDSQEDDDGAQNDNGNGKTNSIGKRSFPFLYHSCNL